MLISARHVITLCDGKNAWTPDDRSPRSEEVLAVCRRIVNAQAEDEALWCGDLCTVYYR